MIRVELDERFEAEVHADLATWRYDGPRPDLVWASPPCTEFSRESMPWCRTGQTPSLELVNAAKRIIDESQVATWVIENVRGATKYLNPLFGKPRSYGPVFLWGEFPRFKAKVNPWKERLSSTRKAERAEIPWAIGDGLRRAIENDLFFMAQAN